MDDKILAIFELFFSSNTNTVFFHDKDNGYYTYEPEAIKQCAEEFVEGMKRAGVEDVPDIETLIEDFNQRMMAVQEMINESQEKDKNGNE